MSLRARAFLPLTSLLLLACGSDPPPPAVMPAPTATTPPAPPAPTASTPPPAPKPSFENPGGMWMPAQMTAHATKLQELGLQIDPAQLADPTSDTLSAIVSLGGCSASFVSPDGLIITNHHCVQPALQYNSTPSENLIKDGFLARTRADERSAGPTARVYVTRAVTDVTEPMLAGISAIKDDTARHKKIESRQKELVAECEKGHPELRCSVASFYEGAQFFRIEQLEIRDVRLVYAPPRSIGNYGGEVDNWRWPRHGDFSFYRAYVGKDGQPADFSADNVPFHAPHHLQIASTPLEEGDLVIVAGYPGRTSSLKTGPEVQEAVEWFYPRRIKWAEDNLAAIEKISSDKEVAIKANTLVRGLGNALTNYKGQVDGLVKGGIAKDKAATEAALATWIAADPQRKATYGTVLEDIGRAHADAARTRDEDADVREIAMMPRLVGAAEAIVRLAEERAKKDEDRHPDYQKRNWKRLEQGQTALEKGYNPTLDRALLAKALERARDDGHAGRVLAALLGSAKPTDEAIVKKVDAILYAGTKIEGKDARLDLLAKATPADLRKSADPIVRLAVALRPMLKAAEDRDDAYAGRMALLKPKYIQALREHAGREIAPDANGTLRLTYGTVRGYSPQPGAPVYRPFTTLSEVVAKATGQEPFDAPKSLLDAVAAHKTGPYVDARLHDVPVDFLSDLHITGGNSGSATLNAKGELVGLAFDGNYEAMASDWVFMPSVTRSIHVDVRYVMWVMDAIGGADDLLRELGKTPAID